MFGRLVEIEGVDPSKREDVLGIIREKIIPGLNEIDGFAGFISLVDDTNRRARSVVLWETREGAEEAERKFAALFENSPEPITLYRLSDGMRLAANRAWEEATGYRRGKVIGQPAAEASLFRAIQNAGSAPSAMTMVCKMRSASTLSYNKNTRAVGTRIGST